MGGPGGQGENQEGRVESGSFLWKSDLIEGMGIRTGGSRIYCVFSARESAGGELEMAIFAFAFMYPGPLAPGCRYVRKYHAMYNLKKKKKKKSGHVMWGGLPSNV